MDLCDTAKPRHRQVFERIKHAIVSGQYQNGDKLPTEVELMKRFSVSKTTVTRAVRDLENVGIIERKQGSGTYVRVAEPTVSTPGICFFMPFITSDQSLPYVEGLVHQHLAKIAGQNHARLTLQCLVQEGQSLEEQFEASVRQVIESKVQGVLYDPTCLPREKIHLNRVVVDKLVEAGLTVVLVDRELESRPYRSQFTFIGYDDQRGGFLLVDHLVSLGCRRIAFIGSPRVATSIEDRFAGYCLGHLAHGIEVDRSLFFEPERITTEFCRSLIDDVRPDAVVCFADKIAASLGQELTAAGIRIGEDIRLAGFDDDPIASLLPVPLTSIRLPVAPFAEEAYKAILQQIENPSLPPRQITIDCELVPRRSSAPDINS